MLCVFWRFWAVTASSRGDFHSENCKRFIRWNLNILYMLCSNFILLRPGEIDTDAYSTAAIFAYLYFGTKIFHLDLTVAVFSPVLLLFLFFLESSKWWKSSGATELESASCCKFRVLIKQYVRLLQLDSDQHFFFFLNIWTNKCESQYKWDCPKCQVSLLLPLSFGHLKVWCCRNVIYTWDVVQGL